MSLQRACHHVKYVLLALQREAFALDSGCAKNPQTTVPMPVPHAVSQFSAEGVTKALGLECLELCDNVVASKQIVCARRWVVIANEFRNQFPADTLYKGINNRLEWRFSLDIAGPCSVTLHPPFYNAVPQRVRFDTCTHANKTGPSDVSKLRLKFLSARIRRARFHRCAGHRVSWSG